LGGNGNLLKSHGIDVELKSGYTIFYFVIGTKVVQFELKDEVKEGAEELIHYLKSIGVEPIMATGDHHEVASKVAQAIGIAKFMAELSPLAKAQYVDELKSRGKVVVMVGDGINDAPALSKADISIAMGSGADIALGVSDIVILNSSLKSIGSAFLISKRTFKFIKQNLTISLIYNLITIPIAIAGYVIPLVASLSMSLSSLLVVGNSMRIKMDKL
jgi:Cu+-exporting ATPase